MIQHQYESISQDSAQQELQSFQHFVHHELTFQYP